MTKNKKITQGKHILPPVDRRTFLKVSSAVAGVAGTCVLFHSRRAAADVPRDGTPDSLETDANVDVKYSVCLACHGACGIKARVDKTSGKLLKLDGSPFHPNCVEDADRIEQSKTDPASSVAAGLTVAGGLCPKGNAGVEALYNPYRILAPLKRRGARGSGKWEVIPWSQAIDEIADRLLPYWTQGPDPDFSGDKTPFYIDPAIPELGFLNNQVMFLAGRLEHGQKEFTDRWFKYGFGSVNSRLDHTSICETSHHVGIQLVSEKGKDHTKPDVNNSEFIIFFGTNPLEASFPMNPIARKLVNMKKGGGKIAVVDPRFSNSAAKADWWVPIRPGTDAALALGILRWLLDNSGNLADENDATNKIDVRYLRNSNQAAAVADNETSFTDATWLVRRDNGEFVKDVNGNNYAYDGSSAVAFSPGDTVTPVEGELITPSGGVQAEGVACDSAFSLLVGRLSADYDVDSCARTCGIPASTINELAAEFAAHGKKACAEAYRGAVQHTNGVYNMIAICYLNLVRGNVDWQGGISFGGGHYHEVDAKAAGMVNLKSGVGNATKYAPVGPRFDRAGAGYDSMTNLVARDGFPAKRPWFPLAYHGVCQEIYPSALAQYPYPVGAMFSYWLDWAYSAPAAKKVAERVLKDENLVPLNVSIDIDFNETAVLADYILPECTYLERWSTPHAAPTMLNKFSGFRQPVVGSLDSQTGAYTPAVGDPGGDPEYSPKLLEDIFIQLGKAIEAKSGRTFPGVGTGAWDLAGASSTTSKPWHADVNQAWDYYANILNNYEIESGHSAQSILDHGGAFEDKGEYSGGKLRHQFNFTKPLHFYVELLRKTQDSMRATQATDSHYDPLAAYLPIRDVTDNAVLDADYPFNVVTWKPAQHTQSRTAMCPTLMMIEPENFVLMNSSDARSLNLETGDTIRIVSASSPDAVLGRVKATEGIRPGVIGVSNSFGHWELSSRPMEVGGKSTGFDQRRGKGLILNPILRLDPHLGDVCLMDKIGGSASFYNTRVRVEKVLL